MNSQPRWLTCVIAGLTLLVGCKGEPLVTVVVMNRTGGACRTALIDLDGRPHMLKANVTNGDAGETGGWPYPMPRNATLRWVTENRKSCSAVVTIPPPPPGRADAIEYDFVLLPGGRTNVAALARDGSSDEAIDKVIATRDDLGRDGGPNYRVGVKNAAGVDIDDLCVRFGPYAVNAGPSIHLSGQDTTIATALPYPVTRLAAVSWLTKDGHAYAKEVDLERLLPSDLNGKCFWFILGPGGDVTARVVNWADLRAGKHPELCGGF